MELLCYNTAVLQRRIIVLEDENTREGFIMQPDHELLRELVRRINEAVHPLKIILFGSAARGEMTANSDLDVLVIMPDGSHRRKTAQTIYTSLMGLGFAKDIIVGTQSDIHQYAADPYHVYKQALHEGKEIFNAAA